MDKEKIAALVEDKIKDTDKFLVDIKLSPNRLSVFIDKPAGITIAECAEVSRHLFNHLDSTGFLESHEMEVSSPGMDEPLKVFKQFLRRIGRNVRVIDLEGKERIGVLTSANENGFSITETKRFKEGKKKMETKEEVTFSYNEVKEVRIQLAF